MSDDLRLSLLWIIPLGGAVVVPLIPDRFARSIKIFAIATLGLTLLLACLAAWEFLRMDPARAPLSARTAANGLDALGAPEGDLVVRHSWIPDFQIEYYLGLDGINVALLVLTAFVGLLACVASWNVDTKIKGYFSLFLLLMSSLMGVFLALDLVLFYVFFEVMLLPMYFLIALWGGPRREYAALKFLLYTLFGSVFVLVAILAVYFWPGDALGSGYAAHTFDMVAIARAATETGYYGRWIQGVVFGLFFVGFCVKLPSFPFHTWLPDAHVEAPTPVSMVLAGVLLKIGGYGLIRMAWPLAPLGAQAWAYPAAALGVFSILYGALAALAQTDFKKLVAYSSVSHMGYVTLGLAAMNLSGDPRVYAYGLDGAMFQMVAHGVTATAMFFLVGVIYDRAHTRDLRELGGLASSMPRYCSMSTVIFFGAMGLPGLCGFVGEVFVVLASFSFSPLLGTLAASAVVLTAGYVLWTLRRVFFGKNDALAGLPDLGRRELFIAAPLVLLTVLLGVYPRLVLDGMSPSVEAVARGVVQARGQEKGVRVVEAIRDLKSTQPYTAQPMSHAANLVNASSLPAGGHQ
jgi:NADH-quinone oxidoreductase subunit M